MLRRREEERQALARVLRWRLSTAERKGRSQRLEVREWEADLDFPLLLLIVVGTLCAAVVFCNYASVPVDIFVMSLGV